MHEGAMKVPGSDNAVIPREKLTGYVLSATHPLGKAKARLFLSHGFSLENVDLLEEKLLGI